MSSQLHPVPLCPDERRRDTARMRRSDALSLLLVHACGTCCTCSPAQHSTSSNICVQSVHTSRGHGAPRASGRHTTTAKILVFRSERASEPDHTRHRDTRNTQAAPAASKTNKRISIPQQHGAAQRRTLSRESTDTKHKKVSTRVADNKRLDSTTKNQSAWRVREYTRVD